MRTFLPLVIIVAICVCAGSGSKAQLLSAPEIGTQVVHIDQVQAVTAGILNFEMQRISNEGINIVRVEQVGNRNNTHILHEGALNEAIVSQGSVIADCVGCIVDVVQFGVGNVVRFVQDGEQNENSAIQEGDLNTAHGLQDGSQNVLRFEQIDSGNFAAVRQLGDGHRLLVLQPGNGFISITQE